MTAKVQLFLHTKDFYVQKMRFMLILLCVHMLSSKSCYLFCGVLFKLYICMLLCLINDF